MEGGARGLSMPNFLSKSGYIVCVCGLHFGRGSHCVRSASVARRCPSAGYHRNVEYWASAAAWAWIHTGDAKGSIPRVAASARLSAALQCVTRCCRKRSRLAVPIYRIGVCHRVSFPRGADLRAGSNPPRTELWTTLKTMNVRCPSAARNVAVVGRFASKTSVSAARADSAVIRKNVAESALLRFRFRSNATLLANRPPAVSARRVDGWGLWC